MTTEAEARSKWCPFAREIVRLSPDFAASGNRGRPVQHNKCAASDCMAWRWTSSFNKEVGFCGLAGKPAQRLDD